MENQNQSQEAKKKRRNRTWLILSVLAAAAVLGLGIYFKCFQKAPEPDNAALFHEKAELLEKRLLSPELTEKLGDSPAGKEAGHAVFLALCSGEHRAEVFSGTGATPRAAWNNAVKQAEAALRQGYLFPVWVRADLVCRSEEITQKELASRLDASRDDSFRWGIALDPLYETALTEGEMNSNKVYDYTHHDLDRESLNEYLWQARREPVKRIPEKIRVFQTAGVFCGDDNRVYVLHSQGPEYGRRIVKGPDDRYVKNLVTEASRYLGRQQRGDGSFVYGIYPRFDNPAEGYNILRHAGTLWAMISRCRIAPDAALKKQIDSGIAYLLSQVVEGEKDRAYLLEEDEKEIKLGGCGLAVIALSEYEKVFHDSQFRDICCRLGNGILSMMEEKTGKYYHILNEDLTKKEEYRTVFYDGEATFALCRLYELTKDEKWLTAARAAADRFVREDYAAHCDQWVAYSLDALTQYDDNPDYYTLALRNVQENLDKLRRDTSTPTRLELVCCAFRTYERMVSRNIPVPYAEQSFRLQDLLDTVSYRAQRMLDGYLYPETAMYLARPASVLHSFMSRSDDFRIRIDDVQHHMGGGCLYYESYASLVKLGMKTEK